MRGTSCLAKDVLVPQEGSSVMCLVSLASNFSCFVRSFYYVASWLVVLFWFVGWFGLVGWFISFVGWLVVWLVG